MIFRLALVTILFSPLRGFADCDPPEFFPLRSDRPYSEYMRVHPSGRYVMITQYDGDGVEILDLSKNPPEVISTPFNREAYPVEPDWDLIASPNHDDSMRYYRFQDVLALRGENVTDWDSRVSPVIEDSQHNQFYHSSATLSENGGNQRFRTLLWSAQQYRDYSYRCNGGTCQEGQRGARRRLCEPEIPNDPRRTRILQAEQRLDQLGDRYFEALRNQYTLRALGGQDPNVDREVSPFSRASSRQAEQIREQIMAQYRDLSELNEDYFGNSQGFMEQPILSKNGQEVAGSRDGETISIYRIQNDGNCQLVENLNTGGSKVNFSYPRSGRRGALTFSRTGPSPNPPYNHENAVFVYDRDRRQLIRISQSDELEGRYPGFTRDGRVIYRAMVYDTQTNQSSYGLRVVSVYDRNGNLCSDDASQGTEPNAVPIDESSSVVQ